MDGRSDRCPVYRKGLWIATSTRESPFRASAERVFKRAETILALRTRLCCRPENGPDGNRISRGEPMESGWHCIEFRYRRSVVDERGDSVRRISHGHLVALRYEPQMSCHHSQCYVGCQGCICREDVTRTGRSVIQFRVMTLPGAQFRILAGPGIHVERMPAGLLDCRSPNGDLIERQT
jgi:hypothetical protein